MADFGVLSSLGLGSQGALNYDIIDKLKKADEDAVIKPIDSKISLDKKREDALAKLTTLLATLKGSASTLSYDNIYSKVAVDTIGTSATATVQDGVSSQTINLDVTNIATNDVQESDSFSSKDSTFTSEADTLKFELASGESFSIDVDENTTISQLEEMINNNSNGTISASILNVGGDNPYKLVIKSTQTGADNAITVSSTGGGSAADDLNLTTVGDGAQDANFTYNGISITRSTNDISDLITGVDIKLVSSGTTTIKISQDTDSLKDSVKSFISAYNDLIDNLDETTKYDAKTKQQGIFQGVSQIRGIKYDINNTVFEYDTSGVSLADFGITQNSTGHLELDESIFDNKIATDPNAVKDFFKGGTETHPEDGLFVKLNDKLKSIFMDSYSEVKLYKNYLDSDLKSLEDQKATQTKQIENKYNILAKKFAAYDKIISTFNAQSQSLQMQIQSFLTKK